MRPLDVEAGQNCFGQPPGDDGVDRRVLDLFPRQDRRVPVVGLQRLVEFKAEVAAAASSRPVACSPSVRRQAWCVQCISPTATPAASRKANSKPALWAMMLTPSSSFRTPARV